MRNISFFLTTEQIRKREKTVTHRLGWRFLKPGDRLQACVKCMGLKRGKRSEKLGRIRVLDVRVEPLSDMLSVPYGTQEAQRERIPRTRRINTPFERAACFKCLPLLSPLLSPQV